MKTLLTLSLLLCACGHSAPPPPAQAPAGAAEPSFPYTPSLDPSAMDRTVDPCVDFYEYACGGWRKANPIPPDQSGWGVYRKLFFDNLAFIRQNLERAAAARDRDRITQQIGDLYAACMDEAGVNARGLAPLQPELDAIAAAQSTRDLAPLIARLQLIQGLALLNGASAQDPDDSDAVIAELDQGGLGLPDRDYYFKDDPESREIRARYLQYLAKVFELLGEAPAAAQPHAATVMRIETALAKASWTNVERRDPYKLKNKMSPAQLQALAPDFDWTAFFRALDAPAFTVVNVGTPAYLAAFDAELKSETIADWRSYLRFHLVDDYAPYLSEPFVREQFEFRDAFLRGAKAMQPRWKRCVQMVNGELGEAVGQDYVRKVFSDELKRSTLDMVRRIEAAMEARLGRLEWMSPPTRARALQKLHTLRNKIGFPDTWRDYGSVHITAHDLVADLRNTTAFESHRQWNKIGKPTDRDEWGMTPQEVNAYYNAQMNDINFPAAVLQPPLYDPRLDSAPNYGNTGGTIGHELIHGFDDEGRQFDAKGNLADWWTKPDAEQFDQRVKCVEDQYSSYLAVDDVHVNGKLTLGENVADLGGEILAFAAWKQATLGMKLVSGDGLTPDQRFFVGFAQWACTNRRPEQERLLAQTDPHAPPRYRINGVVVNMPEFAAAFSCRQGQPMVKPEDQICRIW